MSLIQQFQSFQGNVPVSRRQALLGLSLLALTACSRSAPATAADSNVAYYTCTMHPFVRSQDPKGKCPVCGMDLVPVAKSSANPSVTNAAPAAATMDQPGMVNIAPERMQEIGVTTEVVTKRSLTRSLRAPARAEVGEASRDHAWIIAQFEEDDAAVLVLGQKLTASFPSLPRQKFVGAISFIAPRIDEQHRIAARMMVPIGDHIIRSGLFAEVSGEIPLGERLAISTAAVIPTGNKFIVFVDHGGGKLEPREIEVGIRSGDNYEVLSGLNEGDRVVSSANFLIDAESRIQGVLKTWGDRP